MSTPGLIGLSMAVYLVVLLGIGLWSRARIHDAEDFMVAGRRLPLSMAWATLLATWFGAGTLLASVDEVKASGLRAAALEPIGPGLCLLVAGAFYAMPLWRMKLLTMGDFYRDRFGRRAEIVYSISVFSFFGWIAAQLVGMAGILGLVFGIPHWAGVIMVGGVAMAYTLLGGMWSVTLTDALQVTLLLIGLVILGVEAFQILGDGSLSAGIAAVAEGVSPERRDFTGAKDLPEFLKWLAVLTVGTLGNLPSSDLQQRVFAAKSPKVARAACLLAGGGYLIFGMIPVALGLAAPLLLPESVKTAVLPALAQKILSPGLMVIFVVTLMSAVLSTLDSAILSPSTLLANNIFKPLRPEWDTLRVTRWCVVGVTVVSILLAFAGESAYGLLMSSYALDLAGSFVPLTMGLFFARGHELAAVTSMVLGYSVWAAELLVQLIFGVEIPSPIPIPFLALAVSFGTYLVVDRFIALRGV